MKVSKFLKTFSFISFILLSACSKKKDETILPSNITLNQPHYVNGKLGTSSFSIQQGQNRNFDGTTSSSMTVYDSNTGEENYYFLEGNSWINLSTLSGSFLYSMTYTKFYTSVPNSFPTLNDLNSIYFLGRSTLFSQEDATLKMGYSEGWTISYKDEQGEIWSSQYTNANQSASYVDITWTGNEVINRMTYFVIKGKLSCTMYNSNGDSKIFTANFYNIASDYSKY
ncbi:MAG: hypothetical protein MUE33_12550 [Cytophagaceae bacterium]|jgi:hypothetical protein|nr:hypothetical protein [Cytophagaceae bacterium]